MLPVPIGWIFEPDDPWEQFDRAGEFTPFTPIVNVTGQPAATVPFGVVEGLPIGVQLIGPPAGEAVLFRLAAQLEQAYPWADRLPVANEGAELGSE
jgi:amidase